MSKITDRAGEDDVFKISRRTALKAVAATSGSIALFSGAARATDDSVNLEIECTGDEIKVTLKEFVRLGTSETVQPTDSNVSDIKPFLGKLSVIDQKDASGGDGPNGAIDAGEEIRPCVDGADWCDPVAFPTNTEQVGDDVCYTFDRAEAGLNDVTGTVDLGFAGTYQDEDADPDRKQPLTFDEIIREFDLSACCTLCESGEDLLVKYEWNGNEFVVEGDGDEHIELTGVTEDEDGEPTEACFDVEYCAVDAVVKAGNEYETTGGGPGEICVSGIESTNPAGKAVTHAISNVRFYCEAPDDLGVGNSGEKEEKEGKEKKEKGKGKKEE